ncbi:MAG: c-type cytochrome [Saprospiraceae bacterium]
MCSKAILSKFIFLFVALTISWSAQAAADIKVGQDLFKANCASCHNKNMKDNLTGPALGQLDVNWSKYPRTDLYKWIRSSSAMIAAGHPRATELWGQWKPTVMTPFPALTDEQIESILLYVDGVYKGEYPPKSKEVNATGVKDGAKDTGFSSYIYMALLFILVLLAVVLTRIVTNLNHLVDVKEGKTPAEPKSIYAILTSKKVIGFVIFALIVLGGYTTVQNAVALGRQQGYEPEQPIKFSHALHAGTHKIDCQYCHDGARRSKQSIIPAANTCMNCHRAIKKGSLHGTGELTKIFASIGYNPTTDKYIDNYDKMSQKDIESIYKKWIVSNVEEGDATAAANEQWDEIRKSLTNEQKKNVQGPIEWKLIHKEPDHVYFNHAQHVTAGKVACQQCHGKVEEMEVVKQYASLSMGWCINCHRQTAVKFKDNKYYDDYTRYHQEMKDGKRDKVTVEEIGGLECQKCHY